MIESDTASFNLEQTVNELVSDPTDVFRLCGFRVAVVQLRKGGGGGGEGEEEGGEGEEEDLASRDAVLFVVVPHALSDGMGIMRVLHDVHRFLGEEVGGEGGGASGDDPLVLPPPRSRPDMYACPELRPSGCESGCLFPFLRTCVLPSAMTPGPDALYCMKEGMLDDVGDVVYWTSCSSKSIDAKALHTACKERGITVGVAIGAAAQIAQVAAYNEAKRRMARKGDEEEEEGAEGEMADGASGVEVECGTGNEEEKDDGEDEEEFEMKGAGLMSVDLDMRRRLDGVDGDDVGCLIAIGDLKSEFATPREGEPFHALASRMNDGVRAAVSSSDPEMSLKLFNYRNIRQIVDRIARAGTADGRAAMFNCNLSSLGVFPFPTTSGPLTISDIGFCNSALYAWGPAVTIFAVTTNGRLTLNIATALPLVSKETGAVVQRGATYILQHPEEWGKKTQHLAKAIQRKERWGYEGDGGGEVV